MSDELPYETVVCHNCGFSVSTKDARFQGYKEAFELLLSVLNGYSGDFVMTLTQVKHLVEFGKKEFELMRGENK